MSSQTILAAVAACLIAFAGTGCKPKAEFYIDGVAYYTSERCTKSYTIINYIPIPCGKTIIVQPHVQTICIESVTDTIKITP